MTRGLNFFRIEMVTDLDRPWPSGKLHQQKPGTKKSVGKLQKVAASNPPLMKGM